MGDTTQMLTAETKETSNSKVTPVFDQVTCHEDVSIAQLSTTP